MNNRKVSEIIPSDRMLLGVTDPKGIPLRVIPLVEYEQYRKNFPLDDDYCVIKGSEVHAAENYRYDHLVLQVTENLKDYQFLK